LDFSVPPGFLKTLRETTGRQRSISTTSSRADFDTGMKITTDKQ